MRLMRTPFALFVKVENEFVNHSLPSRRLLKQRLAIFPTSAGAEPFISKSRWIESNRVRERSVA